MGGWTALGRRASGAPLAAGRQWHPHLEGLRETTQVARIRRTEV